MNKLNKFILLACGGTVLVCIIACILFWRHITLASSSNPDPIVEARLEQADLDLQLQKIKSDIEKLKSELQTFQTNAEKIRSKRKVLEERIVNLINQIEKQPAPIPPYQER